jgi:hypothetical protein
MGLKSGPGHAKRISCTPKLGVAFSERSLISKDAFRSGRGNSALIFSREMALLALVMQGLSAKSVREKKAAKYNIH